MAACLVRMGKMQTNYIGRWPVATLNLIKFKSLIEVLHFRCSTLQWGRNKHQLANEEPHSVYVYQVIAMYMQIKVALW